MERERRVLIRIELEHAGPGPRRLSIAPAAA